MTTATPPAADTPAAAPEHQSAARTSSRARSLAWPLLMLLLIAGAVALVAHAWNISRAQRDEAARNQQRLSALERQLGNTQAELAAQGERSQHTETALHALRAELAALDERTTHTESAARSQPAAPDVGNAVTALSLDQAELLLMLGTQRAQHDADSTSARALYLQADAILARLPAADLAQVRQTLAAELDTLAAWSEHAHTRTAAAADDEAANPPATPPPNTWWQRALAGWIDVRPTSSVPPPAEPAPPVSPARADSPALGSTLQQLRMLRRAE